MQALFYMDMREAGVQECLALFCRSHPPGKKAMPLFLKLVNGVVCARDQIDAVIESVSSHWKVNRMSGVDRNVLRIAAFEMLCCEDIPAKVSINEAIDIGKRFGTDESGAFINGILDSIRSAAGKNEVRIDVDIPEPVMPAAGGEAQAEAGRRAPAVPLVAPVRGRRGVVRRRKLGPSEES
jgi:transcription antitermination protein NusB